MKKLEKKYSRLYKKLTKRQIKIRVTERADKCFFLFFYAELKIHRINYVICRQYYISPKDKALLFDDFLGFLLDKTRELLG